MRARIHAQSGQGDIHLGERRGGRGSGSSIQIFAFGGARATLPPAEPRGGLLAIRDGKASPPSDDRIRW